MNSNTVAIAGAPRSLEPGVVRTYSGKYVDIVNPHPDSLDITDIAWSLGRVPRYNGHTYHDYYVAQHCLIMSYFVPPEYALEALLHDATEAYMGDLIYNVKALLPEYKRLEDRLGGHIFAKFDPSFGDVRDYEKSDVVADADVILYNLECFNFGDRPGIYNPDMQAAWLTAISESEDTWHHPQMPYLKRYYELTIGEGAPDVKELTEMLTKEWYSDHSPDQPDVEEIIVAGICEVLDLGGSPADAVGSVRTAGEPDETTAGATEVRVEEAESA